MMAIKRGAKRRMIAKKESMVYVPLLQTLGVLLSSNAVTKEVKFLEKMQFLHLFA